MDTTTWITVVITAVVTAIVKELVSWLIGLLKNAAAINTIKAKLKAIFSRTNLAIMSDAGGIIFYTAIVIYFISGMEPPTRIEIVLLIGAIFADLFMIGGLLVRIAKIQIEKENAKRG